MIVTITDVIQASVIFCWDSGGKSAIALLVIRGVFEPEQL